jgi:hypothetical protein
MTYYTDDRNIVEYELDKWIEEQEQDNEEAGI